MLNKLLCCFLTTFTFLFIININSFAEEIFQTPKNENYIRRDFTTGNGLPQNTVLSMVQTKDGYIWIATFGGLVRYDGVNFKIFTSANTPELADNRISFLYEDRYGVLWIGSEDGVLTNYKDGVFTLIKITGSSVTDRIITPIYLDRNDLLWFKSSNNLHIYDTKTKAFKVFDSRLFAKSGTEAQSFAVRAFAEDSSGNLWIAAEHGLIRFCDDKFTVFDQTDGLPDSSIYFVKETSDGDLLVVTGSGAGFFRDGKFTKLNEKPAESFSFPTSGTNKESVFYHLNEKLYRFANGEITSFEVSDGDGIRTVLADNEGNVWVGKNLSLTQYKPRHLQSFWWHSNEQVSEATVGVIEDKDGSVFISSKHQIMIWKNGNFASSLFPAVRALNNSSAPAPEETVDSTMARDNDGNVWIGTGKGLFKYEQSSLIKFDTGSEKADKFFVRALLFSKATGSIWSASFNSGIQEYQNGKSKIYTTADGLIDNQIACLFETRSGVLWVCARSGISRFENGVFTNFTTENGLTNNNVRDLYEDIDGTLWIGTYGGGILRYRDRQFVPITTKNGLPEDIASRLLLDDQDNFWILGNQGVYSVSRSSLNDFADGKTRTVYCNAYGIRDGMKTSEGNGGQQPAGWKTRDGRLWFPMIEGGIIVDPPKIKSPPAPVYIEDVIWGGKPLDARQGIVIDPDEKQLQINYTAIQFTKPEQIKFQYKLDGYDAGWREAGIRRTVFYQFLPPGTYTFKVRAITADGVWSESRNDLKLVVRSGLIISANDDGSSSLLFSFPFNQYWWLYFILTLSIAVAVAAVFRNRLRKINRRRLEQQKFSRQLMTAHESERHRIAADLHDSIGQSLALIKNMALSGFRAAKDTDSTDQFERILAQSAETIAEVRNITYNLRPHLLDKLGLTEEIRTLLEKLSLTDAIDIYSEIDDIDNLFPKEADMNIYRVIQESFNNIMKHSDASEARLEIKKISGKVIIKIQDDGRGFDPNNRNDEESGFGLVGLTERVQMLNGTCAIQSKIGHGTAILINLPINHQA